MATLQYRKNNSINYLSAGSAAVAALVGSSIGAWINMLVDENILRLIMIGAVPIIGVFLIFKKDFGDTDTSHNISKRKMIVLSVLIGFIIGMYDGFFGPGTGTFLALAFTGFVGFDLIRASGNTKVVNLASNAAALITFAIGGKVLWSIRAAGCGFWYSR